MAQGLVVLSNTRDNPEKIVGHPDLGEGSSVMREGTLYISLFEAIYREQRGEDVEVHINSTPEDERLLHDVRARVRSRWGSDDLPDGWGQPLSPAKNGGDAPDALQPFDKGFAAVELDWSDSASFHP